MSDFAKNSVAGDKKTDPALLAAAQGRISVCKAKLLLRQPFYGVLLAMMDFLPDSVIPTMATNGSKIYYNPEFAMKITEDEVFGVLLHEISHCIYMHCTNKRRMNRASHRWNVASDYVVNLEIKSMGYALPHNTLLNHDFHDMNAEQVYDALPEDCDDKQTFDTHIDNSDESDWDDMEERVITAYEMAKNSKGQGNMPGGLERWINKLRKNKVKWERVFHRYVGQALSKDDYSYTRVNKRFVGQDMYLPDLRSNIIGNVVIAIDTSGSIGKNCLEQFAAEIAKIGFLVNEITAMSCDAEVQEVVKINKFENFLKKLQMRGGGGTDFQPVFDKVKEMKIVPELVVYLTDGAGHHAEKRPPYPVLWVLTDDSCISSIPWGQVVVMPQEGKDY